MKDSVAPYIEYIGINTIVSCRSESLELLKDQYLDWCLWAHNVYLPGAYLSSHTLHWYFTWFHVNYSCDYLRLQFNGQMCPSEPFIHFLHFRDTFVWSRPYSQSGSNISVMSTKIARRWQIDQTSLISSNIARPATYRLLQWKLYLMYPRRPKTSDWWQTDCSWTSSSDKHDISATFHCSLHCIDQPPSAPLLHYCYCHPLLAFGPVSVYFWYVLLRMRECSNIGLHM